MTASIIGQIAIGVGARGAAEVRSNTRRLTSRGFAVERSVGDAVRLTPDPAEANVSTSETSGLVTDLVGLRDHIGAHLGYTEWREMERERVDRFADVTEDHNFIHVDPERAKQTPYGGTIAHGYLTLSLAAPIVMQLLDVTDARVGVNYGLDKVRFPAPLPVGAQWRGGAELVSVEEAGGGMQVKARVRVEVRGSDKPAMVAQCLVRLYG
jgi:acyl dehydratase